MRRAALILGYHNVASTPFFASRGSTATDGFRRQMRLLKAATTPISMAEAVRFLSERRELPPRATVVTFDDGYRDNLLVAAPILEMLGIPATFFLVPQFLSSRELPWWEHLAWAVRNRGRDEAAVCRTVPVAPAADGPDATLGPIVDYVKSLDEADRQQAVKEAVELLDPIGSEPESPMLDWEEAKQLAAMGFDIGSHSTRHAILSNEAPDNQLDDLRAARTVLEQGLGQRIDLLAYPNGNEADFDDRTLQAARQSGYRAAVTTINGWNGPCSDLFALRRFVMYPEHGPIGFGVIGRHFARQLRSRSQRHLQ